MKKPKPLQMLHFWRHVSQPRITFQTVATFAVGNGAEEIRPHSFPAPAQPNIMIKAHFFLGF